MRIAGLRGAIGANWPLIVILALGTGLRLWSIDFGLPYTYAPDEAWHLSVPLRMLKTGDLNPHWLGYPHLAFYVHALALLSYFLVGKGLGFFGSLADLTYGESIAVGVGRLSVPSEFLLARGLTALVGSLSIVLVYLIGRRRSRAVGLIAALLFAVSPANVANSHLIRLDTFAVLFVLLASLWIDRAYAEPNLRNTVLAGVGVGLAFSGKYNAVLIAVALVVAHLLNFGWRGLLRKEIYLAGFASVVTFALTNPFSVLDLPGFFQGLGMAQSAQTTHAGMEGDTVRWYASFLWETEGLLVLIGLGGVVRAVLSRTKRELVLISFPLVYYAFINLFSVRNDRTVMLVIPFLDLLAAGLLVEIYARVRGVPSIARRVALAGITAAVGILVWHPLVISARADSALAKTDSRETARLWIDENLPRNSRVALEAYSPYVDPDKFFVEGFQGIIDHPPDWYVQNGFEYLILSYGAYGRFYEDAARYPDQRERYDTFFSRFPEVKHFDDGGYEVRVLKTNAVNLPAHRIGARWGVYAHWLELVGYDWRDPTLRLYWRLLEPRKESLTLTMRLLDDAGREIVYSDSVFPKPLSSESGIVNVAWTLEPPVEARPGLYRLELDLDAAGQGRVPVLARDYEPISDKYLIDDLKFALGQPSASEWALAHPVNIKFGEVISLVRYSQSDETVRAGDLVTLTLFWQAQARMSKDYTLFVHLLDAQGNIRCQFDAMPRAGAYPTSVWDAGELVRDQLALALPGDLATGDYDLELGWYELSSLTRLDVVDVTGKRLGDHMTLSQVSVR